MSQYLLDHWFTQQHMGVAPRSISDLCALHVEADGVIRTTIEEVKKIEDKKSGKRPSKGEQPRTTKGPTGAQRAMRRQRRR